MSAPGPLTRISLLYNIINIILVVNFSSRKNMWSEFNSDQIRHQFQNTYNILFKSKKCANRSLSCGDLTRSVV